MGDVGVAMGEWGKQLFMHAYRTLEADPPKHARDDDCGRLLLLGILFDLYLTSRH